LRKLKRTLTPEIEKVHEVIAHLDGRVRWPQEITQECVRLLQQGGMVKAAIADELGVSDRHVERMMKRIREAANAAT
jgi:hypothetical protein